MGDYLVNVGCRDLGSARLHLPDSTPATNQTGDFIMIRNNLWLPLLLALSLGGCAAETASNSSDGPPPPSAEEQAIIDNMKKGTLAEISVGEGTVSFIEIAPGDVIVSKRFPIGAEVPEVQNESKMSLEELFAAYAPNEPIPEVLSAAMERSHDLGEVLTDEPELDSHSEPEENFAGVPTSVPARDGVSSKQQELSSSISQQWFVDTFCGVHGPYGTSQSFCFTTAWQGAYGTRKSHVHNAVICGDTGAARAISYVSGDPRVIVDVPYGQCWTVGRYEGPHNAFGTAMKRTLRTQVEWAESSVRMAAYWIDNDSRPVFTKF